jgi:pimeloyl-ACP methyl ester carboxylesterase
MKSLFAYLRLAVVYSLCVFYTSVTVFKLIVLFITKAHTQFWKVKDRPVPPKVLQNPEFGEHKYITANGIKFHYVEKGDHSKPLMLFVHGFPEFWYSWRYQLKEFSKDYWCVAIDNRGYGDSEKPKGISPYNIDALADDIKAIAYELVGNKKFILVAHDWGAVIAWKYAYTYMDTLEKYICLDAPPSPVWSKSVFTSWDQFKKSWYVFYFQMPCLPEFTARIFDLKLLEVLGEGSKIFTEEDLEAYKYTFGKPGALTGPINYYRNLTSPRSKPTRPKKFAPGLYLIGEHDHYISQSTGPAAQKIYENLEYKMIPGAHHFAQQEVPDQVNKLIYEFLKK